MPERGVYGKYTIGKADGSEIDPSACYFVLRLDTDPAARAAMKTYARKTENEELARDIEACIDELESPNCGCREAMCPHVRTFSSVWSAGEPENCTE